MYSAPLRCKSTGFYAWPAMVLAVASLSMPVAAGAYWLPRLQAGAGHDNNVRMAYDVPGQTIEESSLFQAQVDGELGIDSGVAKSKLFGRYWYQSVPGNHDYDADIAQFRVNHTSSTERSLLTLDMDAQYDTTLTSEFEGSGLSLNEKKDRRNLRNKLGYRWQLSELAYVNGEISTESVRYFDAENTGLSDYDTQTLTASYGRNLSERVSGGAQVVYSVFDIPELGGAGQPSMSYETENVIAVLFGDFGLSERDKLILQAGFRTSNFYREYGPFLLKDEGNGRVFSTTYSRRFDTSALQLYASRDLRPNGAGEVVEQDSVGVTMQHSFDARLSANLGLSGNRQREPDTSVVTSVVARDFAQLSLGFRYAASEQHALALELNRRWQQYDSAEKPEAESTGIFLRWYWNPPQTTL